MNIFGEARKKKKVGTTENRFGQACLFSRSLGHFPPSQKLSKGTAFACSQGMHAINEHFLFFVKQNVPASWEKNNNKVNRAFIDAEKSRRLELFVKSPQCPPNNGHGHVAHPEKGRTDPWKTEGNLY